jgi:hypothetical protein
MERKVPPERKGDSIPNLLGDRREENLRGARCAETSRRYGGKRGETIEEH